MPSFFRSGHRSSTLFASLQAGASNVSYHTSCQSWFHGPWPHSVSCRKDNEKEPFFISHTTFNWNDRWQNVCDAVCEDSKMDSSSVLEITSQYCEGMKNEMNSMREKIFYHFLCPEAIRSYLKDGFNDRDCSYYSENGSLFIIPMHVGSVQMLNKGTRFSE